ncbi:MAG: hypothetical protein PUH04_04675 [Firmicutes bacterium]|nr:hypothetical protein [Bacillota bacterium]
MSKFLKIIVNLVVIGSILVAAALLIPPVAGINTVMSDNSTSGTNLPVGAVAYGKTVETDALKKGDKVIYTTNNQAYVYEITDMDASAGAYKVRDSYSQSAEEQNIQLLNDAVKVIVVVPYIAYAAIALQSKEGLIVVGLGVIFLIILFILAELWRKDDEEEEEDSEEDSEEVQTEEKLSRKERKRRKKEEKRSRKQAKKGSAEETASEEGKLSLFADAAEELSEKVPEIEETIVEPDTDQTIDLQATFEGDTEEYTEEDFDATMQDAMNSIAESLARVQSEQMPVSVEMDTVVLPFEELEPVSEEQEISLENLENLSEEEPEEVATEITLEEAVEEPIPENVSDEVPEEILIEQEEPAEELPDVEISYEEESYEEEESCNEIKDETEQEVIYKKDVVPRALSREELMEAARKAGESPEIIEDEENHITFLDYSNLL